MTRNLLLVSNSNTRRTMLSALNRIAAMWTHGRADAESFPWHRLTREHTLAIQNMLIESGYALTTCRTMMGALRNALRTASYIHLLNEDKYLYLVDRDRYLRAVSLPRIRGSTLPTGRVLSMTEWTRLFTACASDPTPAGRRDAAFIALMSGYGLRPFEAAALDLKNYNRWDTTITLRGKGGRARIANPFEWATWAFWDWLAVRGIAPGPLLCQVRKGGRLVLGTRLTTEALRQRFKLRARQAGLAPCSLMDLRRTYVTKSLQDGISTRVVQHDVGHSRLQTTARYDMRREGPMRAASENLRLPFMGTEQKVSKTDRQSVAAQPSPDVGATAGVAGKTLFWSHDRPVMPWHVRVRKATLEQRATKESRKVSEYEREGDSTCRYEIELIAARCVRKSALPKAHDPVEGLIARFVPRFTLSATNMAVPEEASVVSTPRFLLRKG